MDAAQALPGQLAARLEGIDAAAVDLSVTSAIITAQAADPAGRGHFYVWDSDSNTLNDLPSMGGIDVLREQCAAFGLHLLHLPPASTVHGVLRPMLQTAGYDLSRASGVPLAMDYNLRNTYEALDDAGVAVGSTFAALEDQFAYTGDHKTDQTDDRQHLAGFGWGSSSTDVGIEE
eukprot:SAG31_NODE_1367_length_8615_cov_12.875763_14_plen_175_part_00